MPIYAPSHFLKKYLPDERITVAVYSAGFDSYYGIPFLYLIACNYFLFVYDADRKTCHVVLTSTVTSRHLGRFPANKSASALTASFCYPRNDIRYLFCSHLSCCNIVEEEQRFRTLAKHIIYTHGNTVYTNSIMAIHHECYLQFGSHSVCAANKHRLFHSFDRQPEESPEASQSCKNIFIESL